MQNIKLTLPLQHIFINQPFGVNFVDFYQKLGLKGHNGIDFKAFSGCPCYAMNSGIVNLVEDPYTQNGETKYGLGIEIFKKEWCFKSIQYHLKEFLVKDRQFVNAGDLIGYTDNTGLYTTGDHDHVGGKMTDLNGNTINKNNGYNGAIDISELFYYTYNGQEINPKDYDKSRCYHRYYRGRPKGGFFNEKKILAILGLKKIFPTTEKINALVYGGWDLETVKNPSMYNIYSQLKKDEFLKGYKPFQSLS